MAPYSIEVQAENGQWLNHIRLQAFTLVGAIETYCRLNKQGYATRVTSNKAIVVLANTEEGAGYEVRI